MTAHVAPYESYLRFKCVINEIRNEDCTIAKIMKNTGLSKNIVYYIAKELLEQNVIHVVSYELIALEQGSSKSRVFGMVDQ